MKAADPPLEVRGRIDGLYASEEPVIIEEIKTTTLSLELVSEEHNRLHWAQAQCYAYMFARQHNLSGVSIHLTYYHLDSRKEKTFERHFSFSELETFFRNLITPYLDWFRKVYAWQTRRDQSIQQLEFPYADYRPGQRDMAVAVYKAIRANDRLYVQSPTGVGKTIAALFPAVKALGQGLAAKIFYLTAKTSGRLVAEKALDDMRQANLYFRSVTLTAKEKICFCPPVNCDPEVCVFARDYYDKVKRALEEIDRHQAFTRPVIEEIARQYEICPFEFSLDLALWVDCIICDYNYAFDPRVYLHRFFDLNTEPYIFLVDEAHNLPDRARSMYSAELDKKTVLSLQRTLKPHLPVLAKKLGAINKLLLEKRKACQAEGKGALVETEPPGRTAQGGPRIQPEGRRLAGPESGRSVQAGTVGVLFPVQQLPADGRIFRHVLRVLLRAPGSGRSQSKIILSGSGPHAGRPTGAQPIDDLFLGHTAANGLLYEALDRRCGSFPGGSSNPLFL